MRIISGASTCISVCVLAAIGLGFEGGTAKIYALEPGGHLGGMRIDDRIDVTLYCEKKGLFYNSFVERRGHPHYEPSKPQKYWFGMEMRDGRFALFMVTCGTRSDDTAGTLPIGVSQKK